MAALTLGCLFAHSGAAGCSTLSQPRADRAMEWWVPMCGQVVAGRQASMASHGWSVPSGRKWLAGWAQGKRVRACGLQVGSAPLRLP